MYIRFIAEFKNDNGDTDTGVFQAAAFLRRSNNTFDYDKEYLFKIRDWFDSYLERPNRFNKASRKNGKNVSLSWFKSTATEHLQKMYDMKQILEKYDIEVTVIQRKNSGYIVYEDDYQVSALPHGKDKNLTK